MFDKFVHFVVSNSATLQASAAALAILGSLLVALKFFGTSFLDYVKTTFTKRRKSFPVSYGVRLSEWSLFGRDDEISRLEAFIESTDSICIISGLGGQGKTALVSEFSRQLLETEKRRINSIFFVSVAGIHGETSEIIQHLDRSIAVSLDRLDLLRTEETSAAQLHRSIAALLEDVGPSLIIIDNWDDISLAPLPSEVLELGTATKLIITTRSEQNTGYRRITLGGLSQGHARELAQQCAKRYFEDIGKESRTPPTDDILDEAIELCGRNPFAILLVVPLICESSNQTDYGQLQKLIRNVDVDGIALSSHIASFTCDRLMQDPSCSLPLTALTIFPDPLTEDQLVSMCGVIDGRSPAIRKLSRYQVLERKNLTGEQDHSSYSMHPLVRECLSGRPDFEGNEYFSVLTGATKYYIDFLSKVIGNPRLASNLTPDYQMVESHIRNIFVLLEDSMVRNPRSAVELITELGYFFRVREYWDEANRYWKLGASLATQLDGANSELAFRFAMYSVYMRVFRGEKEHLNAYFDSQTPTWVSRVAAARSDTDMSVGDTSKQSVYNTGSQLRLFGLIKKELGDFTSALRFLTQSYDLMKKIGSGPGISRTAHDLADLLLASQPERARSLLFEAAATAKEYNDQIEICRNRRLQGDFYKARRDRRLAVRNYRAALEHLKQVGLPDEKFCAIYGLSSCGIQASAGEIKSVGHQSSSLGFETLTNWLDNRPRELVGRIFRCIVLDWSGVLADDLGITRKCQIEVIERFSGVKMSATDWSLKATANWKQLFSEYISPEKLHRAIEAYREAMQAPNALGEIRICADAAEVLISLKRSGYLLALYSGQLKGVIEDGLERSGLRQYFDHIYCDPKNSKPRKSHIVDICRALNVQQSEIVLVDDMDASINFYHSIGAKCIGVPSSVSHGLDNASHRIRKLKELDDRVANLDKCSIRFRDYYEQRYSKKRLGEIRRVNVLRTIDNLFYADLLCKTLGSRDSKHVLDIGSGSADYRRHWHKKFIAIDVARSAFHSGQTIDLIAEAEKLPISAGAVSGVLCVEVLEHLCHQGDLVALREIERVLSPDGIAIISVPNRPSGIAWALRPINNLFEDAGHLREYDRKSVIEEIERAGLIVKECRSNGFFLLAALLLFERVGLLSRSTVKTGSYTIFTRAFVFIFVIILKLESAILSRFMTGLRWMIVAGSKQSQPSDN